MNYVGLTNVAHLYVHPTYVWAAIIGGSIMGVGFVMGGFCPGTGICAMAIGKIDAMVYIVGILIGVFIFSESFSLFEGIYEGESLGNITLMDTFGMEPEWVIFFFALMAIVAFIVTSFIRKRVKSIFY